MACYKTKVEERDQKWIFKQGEAWDHSEMKVY